MGSHSIYTIENPILLLGYNRINRTTSQLEELQKLVFKSLYVSIDKCEGNLSAEFDLYLSNFQKKRGNSFKFQYQIQKSRLGLVEHIVSAINKVLQKNETVIVLEDDVLISCEGLILLDQALTRYKKNHDFGAVSGFSPLFASGKKVKFENRFRKSPYFPCWGWGTTKKIWDEYRIFIDSERIEKELSSTINWKNFNNYKKMFWLGRFQKASSLPFRTWDIQFQYLLFRKSLSVYLPLLTLTGNIGFNDSHASHTTGKKPFWVNSSFRNLSDKGRLDLSENFLNKIGIYADSMTFAGDSRLMKVITNFYNFSRRKLINKK